MNKEQIKKLTLKYLNEEIREYKKKHYGFRFLSEEKWEEIKQRIWERIKKAIK